MKLEEKFVNKKLDKIDQDIKAGRRKLLMGNVLTKREFNKLKLIENIELENGARAGVYKTNKGEVIITNWLYPYPKLGKGVKGK